jgi:hypothetical protein
MLSRHPAAAMSEVELPVPDIGAPNCIGEGN